MNLKVITSEAQGQMSVDEFLQTLNKKNNGFLNLKKVLERDKSYLLAIYRKDKVEAEYISSRISSECLPIFDKKLGIILEVQNLHDIFVSALFGYNCWEEGKNPSVHNARCWHKLYISESRGYYFSRDEGGVRNLVMNARDYVMDEFDRALFKRVDGKKLIRENF